MDVALLLILPVVGGYYFASHWNFTKFRCAREEGHRLYFRAALYGAFLFIIAYLARTLLLRISVPYGQFEHLEAQFLAPLLKGPDRNDAGGDTSGIVITAVYALMLGLISWAPLNLCFRKGPSLKRAVRDNDFERLIHTAAQRRMPLSVTIENHKVYVGFVVKTTDPSQTRKTLGLLPLISGYRQNDGRVRFTTFYTDLYEEIQHGKKGRLPHLSPEDFEIVLPVDKILSVNMFDIIAYEEFGRGKPRRVARRGRAGSGRNSSAPKGTRRS